MEIKAYICPQCGGTLEAEEGTTFATCPHCGCHVHISYEEQAEKPDPNLKEFTAGGSGIPLAKSVVPPGYTLSGVLNDQWFGDHVPCRAVIRAESPEHDIILTSSSRETYSHFFSPMLKSAAVAGGTMKSGLRDFVEPEQYLQMYGQLISGVPLTPTVRAELPDLFHINRGQELSRMLNRFQTLECGAGNVQIEVANAVCESFLVRFTGKIGGHDVVVLSAADYQGIEYGADTGFMGGMGGLLSGLFSGRGQTAQKAQPQGPIPFGHAREYGKKVDVIRWGAKRLYGLVTLAEKEEEATKLFLRFAVGLIPDPELEQRMDTMEEQRLRQMMQQAQANSQMAMQMQMQNLQRTADLSRQISQNSAQISAGVMDSWNKRQASQSRISQGYSEAIRGVNTWQTPQGRTVEVGTTADHVYQNRYGDTIGVSGTAVDPETAARLNWTELKKSEH